MSPYFTKFTSLICIGIILCGLVVFLDDAETERDFGIPESPKQGYIRQNGDYWVWHDFIKAEVQFVGNQSVTLATHGTYQDLNMLTLLIRRWAGPISLTLYTNGDDFQRTIESLGYLNGCTELSQLREYVNVHICFHRQHMPARLALVSLWYTTAPMSCAFAPPYVDGTQAATYWHQHGLPYPVNLLRNVARMNARTHYVMPLDMSLLMTANFSTKFIEFITSPTLPALPHKSIYCLPTFKHIYEAPLPNTKYQLLKVLNEYKSILAETPYDYPVVQHQWLHSNKTDQQLSVYSISNNSYMCVGYVSVNEQEPLYDERYVLESILNPALNLKMVVLSSIGYAFVNLDGAFLFKRAHDSWEEVSMTHRGKTTFEEARRYYRDWAHLYTILFDN